jgi:hypothetical protein
MAAVTILVLGIPEEKNREGREDKKKGGKAWFGASSMT